MVGDPLRRGQVAEAQQRYEQVLSIIPRAAVAANNLAWLLRRAGQNLGAALDLAQAAKAAMPERPEVSDTLGVRLHEARVPSLAVPPLREAVVADPDKPAYRFRLGQACRAGQADGAKRELERPCASRPTSRAPTRPAACSRPRLTRAGWRTESRRSS